MALSCWPFQFSSSPWATFVRNWTKVRIRSSMRRTRSACSTSTSPSRTSKALNFTAGRTNFLTASRMFTKKKLHLRTKPSSATEFMISSTDVSQSLCLSSSTPSMSAMVTHLTWAPWLWLTWWWAGSTDAWTSSIDLSKCASLSVKLWLEWTTSIQHQKSRKA